MTKQSPIVELRYYVSTFGLWCAPILRSYSSFGIADAPGLVPSGWLIARCPRRSFPPETESEIGNFGLEPDSGDDVGFVPSAGFEALFLWNLQIVTQPKRLLMLFRLLWVFFSVEFMPSTLRSTLSNFSRCRRRSYTIWSYLIYLILEASILIRLILWYQCSIRVRNARKKHFVTVKINNNYLSQWYYQE